MIITEINKLREKSVEISSLEEEEDVIYKLKQELDLSNKYGKMGIGLAAPQIGINKKAAIISIDNNNQINLVNSIFLDRQDSTISNEGCLSLPGKNCKIRRFQNILIENKGFKNIGKFAAYGLSAVCIQHEMDHWDGILLIDKEIKEEKIMGINMLCSCGSGKKYKKCCGRKK